MKTFIEILLWACIAWLIGMFVVGALTQPYDTTDNAKQELRSGMFLYVDHGTGCHYLGTGGLFPSALTPRKVLVNGRLRHVCTGLEQWVEPK